MIVFFVGTPGSGKTYEAVKKIVDNLRAGRTVCTNIDGMDDKRNQEYIKALIDMDDYTFLERFRFLTKTEVLNFWGTRTVSKTLQLPNNQTETVEQTELICPKNSLIVLDEVHKFFNARSWQSETNNLMADWASTHRHDGYDLVMITQDIDKVEKQVRSLTEWCYFFRKVNFLGGAVQKKYLCYAYSGDDHRGQPLSKNVRTYQQKYFPCYKSYTTADAKEVGFMTHVNIFKHPIFFAIPVVLLAFIWMFSKSSLASGDLFGTEKRLKETSQKINKDRNKHSISPAIPSVQKSLSSATVVPKPIADVSVPAPDNSPQWRTVSVTGYIKDGAKSFFLVAGIILPGGQCKNYSPTFKTADCFVPPLPDLEPSPFASSVHHQPLISPSEPVKYIPHGAGERITVSRSINGSDEKETVLIR